MPIKFITGNDKKFEEIGTILEPIKIEQFRVDLDEIQDIDPYRIIEHKLKQALRYEPGEFIVEDTSLYLDCLNNKLPGPLIKWFERGIGNEGIVKLTQSMGDIKATAKVIIGYAKNNQDIKYFIGELAGEIVGPRGKLDFGWGPIFQPTGLTKTFGEMTREEKHIISMRMVAVKKLKEFILKQ